MEARQISDDFDSFPQATLQRSHVFRFSRQILPNVSVRDKSQFGQ
jgi:hypothetical protein